MPSHLYPIPHLIDSTVMNRSGSRGGGVFIDNRNTRYPFCCRYGLPFVFDTMGADLYDELEAIMNEILPGLLDILLRKEITNKAT